MSSRLKSLHRRQVFILVALSLTLGLALGADDATPVVAPPAPATAPVDSPSTAPTTLPAGGGNLEPVPDKTKVTAPAKDKDVEDSVADLDPTKLPAPKPIVIHSERDAEIGRIVGVLLEENHYLQKPITNDMSQRWLDNYFIALDPTHLFFLQSDIDEFKAKYGNNLGQLLLHNEDETTAVAPAFEIYDRYVKRLTENITLAEKLVHEKFDFTKNESFLPRTDKSAWFKDAEDAQDIWHAQVKSDLLNGMLDSKEAKVNQDTKPSVTRIAKRYAAILRDREDMDDMDVIEQYLNGLTHAYDPHSDYFQPDAAQDFAIMAIDHKVTGIGAVLKSEDGYAKIEEVIPGGPADLDKRLQPGDRILAVGQDKKEPVDVVNMKLNRVVDKIRGVRGTMVHLVVLPAGAGDGGAHKDIILKRDAVSIKDSLAKADIIMHPLPGGGMEKIGVINLHDFYNNTASDVAKLVQRLKKEEVAGIILDVRNNGGGLLDQAVALTGLFVNHEPVVQIQRYDHFIDKISTEDSSPIYYGPLVVMVNKASASATEIFAAALQDYGRAIIVGDQSTHGKGTVQQMIPLKDNVRIGFTDDPGSLKMTTQKFYRVAGGSTQQKGVVPDIILPSVLDGLKLGETTLPYYLPYDEVPKADNIRYLNETADYLPTLRANSNARVAASPDFAYVRQDTDYYRKMQNDPVSLNQDQRVKEMADNKAKFAQRKKDLEARKATRDPVLELTLDMVDQNLPPAPPVVKKPKVDADEDPDGPDLASEINTPKVDPQLEEAVDILTDYDRMLHDSGSKLVQTSANGAK